MARWRGLFRDAYSRYRDWTDGPLLCGILAPHLVLASEKEGCHCVCFGGAGCCSGICLLPLDGCAVATIGRMVVASFTARTVLVANRKIRLAFSHAISAALSRKASVGFPGCVRGHSLSGYRFHADSLRVGHVAVQSRLQWFASQDSSSLFHSRRIHRKSSFCRPVNRCTDAPTPTGNTG